MIPESELEVVVFDRFEKIPDDYSSGTVIVFDIEDQPCPCWAGTRDHAELEQLACQIAAGLNGNVNSAHFITSAQYNEAVDLALAGLSNLLQ